MKLKLLVAQIARLGLALSVSLSPLMGGVSPVAASTSLPAVTNGTQPPIIPTPAPGSSGRSSVPLATLLKAREQAARLPKASKLPPVRHQPGAPGGCWIVC